MISDLVKTYLLFVNKERFLIIWGIIGKHWHAGQTIAYLTHKTRLLSIIFTPKNSTAILILIYFFSMCGLFFRPKVGSTSQ